MNRYDLTSIGRSNYIGIEPTLTAFNIHSAMAARVKSCGELNRQFNSASENNNNRQRIINPLKEEMDVDDRAINFRIKDKMAAAILSTGRSARSNFPELSHQRWRVMQRHPRTPHASPTGYGPHGPASSPQAGEGGGRGLRGGRWRPSSRPTANRHRWFL